MWAARVTCEVMLHAETVALKRQVQDRRPANGTLVRYGLRCCCSPVILKSHRVFRKYDDDRTRAMAACGLRYGALAKGIVDCLYLRQKTVRSSTWTGLAGVGMVLARRRKGSVRFHHAQQVLIGLLAETVLDVSEDARAHHRYLLFHLLMHLVDQCPFLLAGRM